MRLIDDIQMMELGEEYVAIPVGDASEDVRGIIRLNETGKVVWDGLANGMEESEIVKQILETYDVDEATATHDVRTILTKLRDIKILVD